MKGPSTSFWHPQTPAHVACRPLNWSPLSIRSGSISGRVCWTRTGAWISATLIGAATDETSTGAATPETATGAATPETATGAATLETATGAEMLETATGAATLLTVSGAEEADRVASTGPDGPATTTGADTREISIGVPTALTSTRSVPLQPARRSSAATTGRSLCTGTFLWVGLVHQPYAFRSAPVHAAFRRSDPGPLGESEGPAGPPLDIVVTRDYIAWMKTAGVRELKARLSGYLRDVARGDVVLVTDRGRVVAELRPPGEEGRSLAPADPRYRRLVERGFLRPAAAPGSADWGGAPAIRLAPGSAQELLDAERGE